MVEQHLESFNSNRSTYESLEQTARFLKDKVQYEPQIGIICGSGLGKYSYTHIRYELQLFKLILT